MTVYIPTMSRYDNLMKIVPRWLDQGIPVRLMVTQGEFQEHVIFGREAGWPLRDVKVIMQKGIGIGAARRSCVIHARRYGLESIIMTDDDMKPVSDARPLLTEAARPGVLGVGAVRPIHDHFTHGAISRNKGVILCPGGWGFQLFGLNVRTASQIGNFDALLHSYGEDAELCRLGISKGIPWRAHCDVRCDSIGARYAPGGINARFRTPELRTEAEYACLFRIHQRWPRYTNPPNRPLRVAWQRMLNDFIPDWRERSALHGGSLWPGAAQSQPESASRA